MGDNLIGSSEPHPIGWTFHPLHTPNKSRTNFAISRDHKVKEPRPRLSPLTLCCHLVQSVQSVYICVCVCARARENCTRLLMSSQAFARLNLQIPALTFSFTLPVPGFSVSGFQDSPKAHWHPVDKHGYTRILKHPSRGYLRGVPPPRPAPKKAWCVSNCKSDCLTLDKVNSRLISPLPTWVWSSMLPTPIITTGAGLCSL